MGCGIGGPGREVARSTGANILGINYNAYQIEKAKKLSRKAQLDHLCSYVKVISILFYLLFYSIILYIIFYYSILLEVCSILLLHSTPVCSILLNYHFIIFYIQGDFCNLHELNEDTYDGGFAFEATCHAKDLVLVYKEIIRILKPGAIFADLAWAMTDTYNPENPVHEKAKHDIMVS